jgi:hypothetical protein
MVHDLERQLFVCEHDEAIFFGFGVHCVVEEAFFEGRHHFHLKREHGNSFLCLKYTGNVVGISIAYSGGKCKLFRGLPGFFVHSGCAGDEFSLTPEKKRVIISADTSEIPGS